MKKYYILLSGIMLTATLQTQAQTKIGGTGAPDGSAMLEVTGGTGNNKGILPPRLTTAQRDVINLPAKALMIYNTTANQLQVNTGTPAAPVWTATNPTNVWNTDGNAGTTPATSFIGTTDAQPLTIRTNGTEKARIEPNGKMGIGTSTPTAQLDIRSADFGAYNGLRLMDNGDSNMVDANMTPGYDMNTANDSSFSFDITGLGYWIFGDHVIPGVNDLNLGRADRRWGTYYGENANLSGTMRITGSTGTPTTITGRNAAGDIGNVGIGTGLSLTGGVLSALPAAPSWALSGNTGSNPTINYIGTADGQPLIFRTNATERMRMQSTGKIGIGTNNPTAQLDIRSADFGAYNGLRLMDNGDSNMVDANMTPGYDMTTPNDSSFTFDITGLGYWIFGDHVIPGVNDLNLGRADRRWGTYYGVNANLAGTLGLGIAIPNYKLDVAGDINASGSVRAGGVVLTSDARLKRNISNTQHGLSTVMALRPVEYEKKNSISESVYNRHEIGFIAQEILKVLPSVVTEGKDADKTLAVSYTELIPVLTKAIQEQQSQIDKQNTQIEALKAENQKLKGNEAVTAQLVERVKQMEQMMGINEIKGTSKVAAK